MPMEPPATKNNFEVKFGDKIFPYSIERRDRTTVGISIEPDGTIVVKAPNNLDINKITQTVDRKRKWIAQKVSETQMVIDPIPKNQEPISGEKIRYKNALYRLLIHRYNKKHSKLIRVCRDIHIYIDQRITAEESAIVIKNELIKWYRIRAESYLKKRIEYYQRFFSIKPKDVKIRDLKLRWGSCTPDGNVIFNWKIVMAPLSAINYVIVHELCHLKEPNHSVEFWAMLQSVLPQYKKWKEWLHINGRLLDLRW